MFKSKYKKYKFSLLLPIAVLSIAYGLIVLVRSAPVLAAPEPTESAAMGEPGYVANDCQKVDKANCGIIGYLSIFINVLSALAGVAIAGSIAYGGIQYSMAGNDPQKVSAAKDRIRNAIIALLFFIFGYGFLNFLVPGGLLR